MIALVTACTPSINQAARTDVDRRIAAVTPSERRVDAPLAAAPQPLAVGQWITVRQTDREQRPSLSTLKIVGAEGDAFWLEVVTDSYFGSSGMKLLVAFGDRTDPARFEIRRAFTRDHDGRVSEMPSAVIQFMRSTFQPVLDSMVIRWDALPQQDARVAAGTFAGCYHGRSTVEPIGTELVDFGREGARSSF